jgi:hypothetical protein
MSNPSHRAGQAPDSPHSRQSADPKRRRFLLALGAGGAGAAAVATTALVRPIAPAAVVADADASQGYQETDHVRDYYATTRI